MTCERWTRFCVVGVGGHARTKLIPAIFANGQQLAGVVSRGAHSFGDGTLRFATVTEAVDALAPDTAFIVASPPTVHFDQAMPALLAGRDVIVEKPAFVTAAEAKAAVHASETSGALLIDGFMNRHTRIHRMFLEEWGRSVPTRVEFTFTLPSAPSDTFRTDSAIGSSNLYDIGSYALAALLDIGKDLSRVTLDKVENAGSPDQELLHLSGLFGPTSFSAKVGIADAYANVMTLVRADGSAISFSPFVFGRPGPRRVVTRSPGDTTETIIEDVNAFEAMFSVPRPEWTATATERNLHMIELTQQLERLGRDLLAFRTV